MARSAPARLEQALELAPHFEHQKLAARIDVGDQNALARQDRNQPFEREPLQALRGSACGRSERGRQHLLGQDVARLEAERDDRLLDLA